MGGFRAAARVGILALVTWSSTAGAAEVVAFYRATWAGLPAAELRLSLSEAGERYRAQIAIETRALPRLVTKFRGGAVAEGRLARDGAALPSSYDALYDLRKRHDSRISMRFRPAEHGVIAERTPNDSSRKPPLAETYRRDVTDPLSALAAIRQHLLVRRPEPGSRFSVPVYDGARRFDVAVDVVSIGGAEDVVRIRMTLMPIAGFKGGEEGSDPDDAPRPIDATFSHDARLVPLTMRVSVAYLPLTVRFDHFCADFASCSG